jgi:hypothetical protein
VTSVGNDRQPATRTSRLGVFERAVRIWPWLALTVSAPAIVAFVVVSGRRGFDGLSVNVVGQIIGDVLLAGVVAPFARRAFQARTGRELPEFPYASFLRSLSRAEHRVQVLDTFSYMLTSPTVLASLDVPGSEFVCFHEEAVRLLRKALERDVVVEILLLRPDSDEVTRRAKQVGIAPDDYRALIGVNLDVLKALHQAVPYGKLDVRVYDAPPGISMHRCDNRMWTSFYPLNWPTVGSAHLELTAGSQNAGFLKRRFNELYEHSRMLW